MAKRRKKNESAQGQHAPWTIVVVLVAVAAVAYAGVWQAGFVSFDDPQLLLENPQTKSLSGRNLVAIFTPQPGLSYQPVRVLSYAVDWQLFGQSARGYHLHNLLLHVLAGLLVAELLWLLLPGASRHVRMVTVVAAAALFLLHPIQVEAVAWVSSRKYGLLLVFLLGSCCCVAQFVRTRKAWWFALALGTALLAALASPFGVVAPALALLVGLRLQPQAWRRHLLMAAGLLPCLLVAIPLFLPSEMAATDHDLAVIKTTTFGWGGGIHAIAGLGTYARNLVVPLWLNARYVGVVDMGWSSGLVWLGLVTVAAAAALVVVCWRRGEKLPAFCFGWCVLGWAPVSGLVPVSTLVADRYAYLFGIGIWLGIGYGIARLVRDTRHALALVGVLVLPLSWATQQRVGVWRNSETLWLDCIAKEPRNYRAYSSLATEYMAQNRIPEAVAEFERAISLNQTDAFPYYNLGLLYANAGDMAKAQRYFEEAYALKPRHPDVLNNLGVVLMDQGLPKEAEPYLRAAIEQAAGMPLSRIHLAKILLGRGDLDEAEALFRSALELDAGALRGYEGLARVCQQRQDYAGAVEWLKALLARRADYAPAHNDLGTCYMGLQQFGLAAASYRRACELRPDLAPLRANLQRALDAQKQANP